MNAPRLGIASSVDTPRAGGIRGVLGGTGGALQKAGIGLALIVLILLASVMSPYFLQAGNLLNVARQVSLIVIVGMGMTFLLTSGGLDISVGAVVAFSGTLAAGLCVAGWPMLLAGLFPALSVPASLPSPRPDRPPR